MGGFDRGQGGYSPGQGGTVVATLQAHHDRGAPDERVIGFAQNQRDEVRLLDKAGSLAAEPGMKQQTYVFQTRVARNGRGAPDAIAPTLTSCEGGTHADTKPHVFGAGLGVRRLMPVECLRLQAFPDDWLDLEPPLSDSAKYRLIGNAITVSVAEWIGRRITKVR